MNYKVIYPGASRKSLYIDLNAKLGRGATALVYRVNFEGKLYAAKIYHQGIDFNGEKIRAMLDNQPNNKDVIFNGQEYPQIAWPIAIIEDENRKEVGFLLSLVDTSDSFTLDHYYDQGLFKKLNSYDEAALSYKLEIAKNLSIIVADLHSHGHHFIDCKPQNIRVFKRNHIVTLIDCDGFSINGKNNRYPAELLSTDYIAPEAQRRNSLPRDLGEPQDRYALAVILFQLLNKGTHPFQGIINDQSQTFNTNDEKAAAGYYPHGIVPDNRIKPRPQSTHHLWDPGTRAMFDQAFTTGSPSARPSAKEWANHFERLLGNKTLVRCEKFPNDLEHIKFKGMECPSCYLKKLPTFVPNSKISNNLQNNISSHQPKSSSFSTQYNPSPIPPKTEKWPAYMGLIALLVLLMISMYNNTTKKKIVDPIKQTQQESIPAVNNSPAYPNNKYISLYASNKSRGIGYSIGNTSREQADTNANNQCEAQVSNKSDEQCTRVVAGFGDCLAISRSTDGGLGAAIDQSPINAGNAALSACKSSGGKNCIFPSETTFCIK